MLAFTSLCGVFALAFDAKADPQGNVSLTIGAAGVGEDRAPDHAEFHLGARGDIMFGRDDAWDFGLGPYVDIGTFAFDEFRFGGGASFHLPVHESFPLVLSAGPFARIGDDDFGLEPGLGAALFWGSRSYNFHGGYIMAAGLSVGYQHVLGDSNESAIFVAAQIDLVVLGLPIIALVNLMRGPSPDAAPLE